jgi:hypothetical protein
MSVPFILRPTRAVVTTALLTLLGVISVGERTASAGDLELPTALSALLSAGRLEPGVDRSPIVTLSILADGCAARGARAPELKKEALTCVEQSIALARSMHPDLPIAALDGLWLTHFDLLLGARDRLGPCPDPELHASVTRALARRSLADPRGHAASYGGRPERWPADQAATLAAIARYDAGHGTQLVDAPRSVWRRQIEGALDHRLGLPSSELSGADRANRLPRGRALSWQTRFLFEVDPALARTWWAAYLKSYLVEAPDRVGLREWPPGVDRPADHDSGPIVRGVGARASSLGVAVARIAGDERLAERLELGADGTDGSEGDGLPDHRLAAAIRYLGRSVAAAPALAHR